MSELLAKLGIDWRLLIAQTINFAILAFILRKFLWKPLLGVIAERQKKAQQIEDAAREAMRAEEQARMTQETIERDARKDASRIIQDAEKRAGEFAAGIRAKAESEARVVVERAEKEAEAARQRIFAETRADLADLALRAAEKVLERSVREDDDVRLAQHAVDAFKK